MDLLDAGGIQAKDRAALDEIRRDPGQAAAQDHIVALTGGDQGQAVRQRAPRFFCVFRGCDRVQLAGDRRDVRMLLSQLLSARPEIVTTPQITPSVPGFEAR